MRLMLQAYNQYTYISHMLDTAVLLTCSAGKICEFYLTCRIETSPTPFCCENTVLSRHQPTRHRCQVATQCVLNSARAGSDIVRARSESRLGGVADDSPTATDSSVICQPADVPRSQLGGGAHREWHPTAPDPRSAGHRSSRDEGWTSRGSPRTATEY